MFRNRLKIILGDITEVKTDAIVNAANPSLLGGGGVDGAIHRKAGKRLLDACRKLHGCNTGEAKITGGFNLPAKYVIHTVGPIWKGGNQNEDKLLSACYRKSLELASERTLSGIAFPAISTGVYGFPKQRAARIALKEISGFIARNSKPQTVLLVCYSEVDLLIYCEVFKELYN